MRESRLKLGQKSTHQVECLVCKQKFGNAQHHDCPYRGVSHAKMHEELRERIDDLEQTVRVLMDKISKLESRSE